MEDDGTGAPRIGKGFRLQSGDETSENGERAFVRTFETSLPKLPDVRVVSIGEIWDFSTPSSR
jgi:hypothetical protein